MADKKDITQIMLILQTAYPNTEVGDYTPKLYMELLQDIPAEILNNAVLHCISKSPFYPRISEIRKAAVTIQLNTSSLPTPAEAWGIVSDAIPRYGRNHRPDFHHPLIERTVDVMGWYNLCVSMNQVADRARFIEAYIDLRDREVDDATTLPQVKELANRLTSPVRLEITERIEGEYDN